MYTHIYVCIICMYYMYILYISAHLSFQNDHLVRLTIWFKLDAYNHISKGSYNQCSPF